MIGIFGNFFKERVEWRGLRTETIVFRSLATSSSWDAFSQKPVSTFLTPFPVLYFYSSFSFLSEAFPGLQHFLTPFDVFLSCILTVIYHTIYCSYLFVLFIVCIVFFVLFICLFCVHLSYQNISFQW